MRSPISCPRLLVLVVVIAGFSATALADGRGDGKPLDRAALRETLKTMWDSLDTIELQETAGICDAQLRPDPTQAYSRCDFARRHGGSSATLTVRIDPPPKGERIASDMRRSGGKRYFVEYFKDGTKTVSKLSIDDDSESDEDTTHNHVRALSFMAPHGKPLFRILEDPSTTVEEARDADGRRFIIMTARVRGFHLRMEIDPDHDWLLRRYQIGDFYDAHVLRFESLNGRWFPVEGVFEDNRPEKRTAFHQPQRSKFVVTGLKLNQPIADSRFAPPPLPKGAIVRDLAKPKARVVGGTLEARRALEKQHPRPKPTQPTPNGPIVASREPEEFPWTAILGGASLALILGAGGLYAWRVWK